LHPQDFPNVEINNIINNLKVKATKAANGLTQLSMGGRLLNIGYMPEHTLHA
jgi:hypothetical protein